MLELIWVSSSMASPYKALNLGKTFPRISRIRIIPSTQILARVSVYLPPFISQILDFICRIVLILILIYFFTYKPISATSRDPESQGLYARLKLPPKKGKTIGYKPRAKLLIVTGHLKNLPKFWVENWKNRSAYRWRNTGILNGVTLKTSNSAVN